MSVIDALIVVGIMLYVWNILLDFLNRKLPTKPSSTPEEPKKE